MNVSVCRWVLLLGLVPTLALGQQDASNSGLFARANVLERIAPEYPRDAQRRGQEGWVLLSFVVDAEGRVHDAVVVDSSGLESFERAAAKVVERWRFEPATLGGVPVAQYDNVFKVVFQLEGAEPGARRKFVKAYRKVLEQFEAGDYDAARIEIEALRQAAIWNLYEDAWLKWLFVIYFAHVGDDEATLTSLRRAIAYDGFYLPPREYGAALRQKYVLESRFGYSADALETFARIVAGNHSVQQLEDHAAQLRELIAGDQIIVVEGSISSPRTPWHFHLSRRSFQFGEVNGELSQLRIRCAQVEKSFDSLDVAWTIPDSWGDCRIYVHGAQGTAFKLLELP